MCSAPKKDKAKWILWPQQSANKRTLCPLPEVTVWELRVLLRVPLTPGFRSLFQQVNTLEKLFWFCACDSIKKKKKCLQHVKEKPQLSRLPDWIRDYLRAVLGPASQYPRTAGFPWVSELHTSPQLRGPRQLPHSVAPACGAVCPVGQAKEVPPLWQAQDLHLREKN